MRERGETELGGSEGESMKSFMLWQALVEHSLMASNGSSQYQTHLFQTLPDSSNCCTVDNSVHGIFLNNLFGLRAQEKMHLCELQVPLTERRGKAYNVHSVSASTCSSTISTNTGSTRANTSSTTISTCISITSACTNTSNCTRAPTPAPAATAPAPTPATALEHQHLHQQQQRLHQRLHQHQQLH
ncbi:hypothetical protein P7K49_026720 [Saguinus oedipus]|uniref:Uncharacterized protein n=1 Tax=Saguinus oedipus TaxID=9490 RepID=A0ABQ9UET9_SAGOE|nr:hypothetical protein P7K49_026720 [Saguinus oedipus]